MSRGWEIFKRIREQASTIAGRFFTPQEYRAALIFLGLGLAALFYRGGKSIVEQYFPSLEPVASRELRLKNDSIFRVLSDRAAARDSAELSLPDDSSSNAGTNQNSIRTEKEKSLSPRSISLNAADSLVFQRLPGVGAVTARRIIAYRANRGKFRHLNELMNVAGIGEGKFRKMEPYLRLD